MTGPNRTCRFINVRKNSNLFSQPLHESDSIESSSVQPTKHIHKHVFPFLHDWIHKIEKCVCVCVRSADSRSGRINTDILPFHRQNDKNVFKLNNAKWNNHMRASEHCFRGSSHALPARSAGASQSKMSPNFYCKCGFLQCFILTVCDACIAIRHCERMKVSFISISLKCC